MKNMIETLGELWAILDVGTRSVTIMVIVIVFYALLAAAPLLKNHEACKPNRKPNE